MTQAPAPFLFATPTHGVRELDAADAPLLQALFDANPAYFLAVSGEPAAADEAQREFDEQVPPHLPFGRRWLCGVVEIDGGGTGSSSGELVGMTIVISDLVATGVWHIALFIVATTLHGSGLAADLHAALQAWAQGAGAEWLRLGVVAGNVRAERFWQRQGYAQVRTRDGIAAGERLNTVRVMVKPLGGRGIDDYLVLVPRDAPGSALP